MNINSSLTALQNDTDYDDSDYFQYRVETFFSEVLLTNAKPIGKIVYYALRIEFEMRASPYLHALI